MIPKKIFFFWAGKKLSWMRYMTFYSFRKLNPDWSMTLCLCNNDVGQKPWKSREVQDFTNFTGVDYMEKIKALNISIENVTELNELNPVHRSDVFRWKHLAENGGFYSDTDILYIKPIDEYYQKAKSAGVVLCNHSYHSIGFLGCSKSNRFFSEVYKHTLKRLARGIVYTSRYQSFGNEAVNAVYPPRRGFASECGFPEYKFYNNSMSLVYPYKWRDVDKIFNECNSLLPSDCIGIHWYAGAGISQKMNNLLNEMNYKTHLNTFTYFARKI
ncbi:MAG: glycosyltransferase [Candidatus Heimdallarchaeaceae archaeon]